MTAYNFSNPDDVSDLEEGTEFAPKFSAEGLITCVVTDYASKEIVMVAHMNREALAQTLKTRIATYWSRSRQSLWVKGEISGSQQRVKFIHTDCDQDTLWLGVETGGTGANCHTGRKSCFYRTLDLDKNGQALKIMDTKRAFDPKETYKS